MKGLTVPTLEKERMLKTSPKAANSEGDLQINIETLLKVQLDNVLLL